jgi:hypothetical protein
MVAIDLHHSPPGTEDQAHRRALARANKRLAEDNNRRPGLARPTVMMNLDMIRLAAGASLVLVLVLASAFIWITEQHGAARRARPAHPPVDINPVDINPGDQS